MGETLADSFKPSWMKGMPQLHVLRDELGQVVEIEITPYTANSYQVVRQAYLDGEISAEDFEHILSWQLKRDEAYLGL